MEFFMVKNVMLKKNNSNIYLAIKMKKKWNSNKIKIDLKSNLTLK